MVKKALPSILSSIEKNILKLSRNVNDPQVVKNNLDYVKDLAKRNIPTLIIKEIINDDTLLSSIARRSYQHVNHFDKIVLIDNEDTKGYRLTLHSWYGIDSKEFSDEELIHNHRFSFWSHIYQGELVAENFEEDEKFSIEKKTFNKFIYTPSATGNVHTCTFDSKAQLTKLSDVCIKEKETYYLNYKTTHRIVLPRNGKNLCTFVLRGPREREYTNTYNTFYPDRGIESKIPMMTADQLKNKLHHILGENS